MPRDEDGLQSGLAGCPRAPAGRPTSIRGRTRAVWALASIVGLALVAFSGATEPADVPDTLPTQVQSEGYAPPVSSSAVAERGPEETPIAPSPHQASTGGWRITVPAIKVDAPVVRMSVDEAGRMMVPSDGIEVGWYDFTAAPGAPGNAVMSGHVDFGRSAAVFWSLRALASGDLIVVSDGDRAMRYSVESVTSILSAEADLAAIIGERSGAETLTLITCGGTFDPKNRAYDRRVVVRATRI